MQHLPISSRHVLNLNLSTPRPRRRHLVRLAITVLARGIPHKILQPRNRAKARLQHGPHLDEVAQRLIKVDNIHHGEADGAHGRGVCKVQRKRHENDGHARDEQVQHDVEPALDAEEEVIRPLRGVEKRVVLAEHGGGPGEGADGRQPGQDLGEVGEERGFRFEVDVAELAGGAEVVLLQEVEGEEGRGDEGGDVGASRGDDGGLGEDGEEAVHCGPGGKGEAVVYEGYVLAEAVEGHAAVCCCEEVEGRA